MKSLDQVSPYYEFRANGFNNPLKECPIEDGMIDYLNTHKAAYNIKEDIHWQPCNSLHYTRTPKGSLDEYKRIMINGKVRVQLYNGDADSVVPFTDTLRNLPLVGAYPEGDWTPWFVGENHAGFYQFYSKMTIVTVNGAGHMVPQDKREESFQMFYNFIKDRPINTPVK